MIPRARREAGQAVPIYITVVASLLFLALAYFVVGQASASRNGAQSAADAAALAAAQDARDQLRRGLLASVLNPRNWNDLLNGKGFGTYGACQEARSFAARNKSDVIPGGCRRLTDGRMGFTVKVKTQKSLGETVVPGTEDIHMTAEAIAVIEPRCTFKPDETEPEDGEDPDSGGSGNDKPVFPGELTCDGRDRFIDPENLDFFPDAADLFTVRLSD
ncbi:pilus assembly protein TadG-related protein [Streptomyces sp. HK10]|uniref:pilus assembly protein TadG-related protein n=1 Tax=Streptomyces sp. HK10 TaxID=3373255 RepID=UPI003749D2F5